MKIQPAFEKKHAKWLCWLDGAVWLGLVALVLFTISRHEPWSDEAQAWLLARDCGWIKLIFGELRYEGSPGLWHSILWIAIHLFHFPYAAIGYVGGAFALAGLAVIVFLAPFPRILRYTIATSFFFVYQYAVVSRSYVLLPLLAFGSAWLFRRGTRAVIPLAVTLSLLAHVSLHGAVIAIAMAVVFAVELRPQWPGLDSNQKKQVKIAGVIFDLALALFAVIVFPAQSKTYVVANAQTFPFWMHYQKMFGVLYGAFSDFLPIGFVILSLAIIWLLERRGALLFLIAAGVNAIIYGFLRGAFYHQGIMLIAMLTAMWAVWPVKAELEAAPKNFLHLHRAMVTALSLLFAWQTYWSVVAIRNDCRGAYSGAKDAAMYLKSIHAETAGCNGYNLWSVGVQPYFDHNIFANFGGPDAPAYYHPTVEFGESSASLPAFTNRKRNPPCLLIAAGIDSTKGVDELPSIMEAQGYELVHTSEGTMFFKNEIAEYQYYWFFMRRPGVPELREQSSVQHP